MLEVGGNVMGNRSDVGELEILMEIINIYDNLPSPYIRLKGTLVRGDQRLEKNSKIRRGS